MRQTSKQNEPLTKPLLPSAKYWMLLVLADDSELHGYRIQQTIKENTRGMINLDVGSTYAYIKKLEQAGLIYESNYREDEEGHSRRHYRLSDLGGQVLIAEQRRIRELAFDSPQFSGPVRRQIFYRALARRGNLALAGICFLWLLIFIFRSLFGPHEELSNMAATLTLQTIPAHFYLMVAAVLVVFCLWWRAARKATTEELEFYTAILSHELPDPEGERAVSEPARRELGLTGGLG